MALLHRYIYIALIHNPKTVFVHTDTSRRILLHKSF